MVAWLLEITASCAVDCFALISGYVGLDANFRWSRLLNLWIQVLFYGILLALIFSIFEPGTVALRTWLTLFLPITTGQYWYVTSYAGMFVFIPLLNAAVRNADRAYLRTFFIIVSIFFCFIPNAVHCDPYLLSSGFSMVWLGTLYLLGAYLKKYDIPKTINGRRAASIFAGATFLTWTGKMLTEKATSIIWGYPRAGSLLTGYLSPTVILNAVALLCLFAGIKVKNRRMQKIIRLLSPAAFGVYLIHDNNLVRSLLIKGCTEALATKTPIEILAFVLALSGMIYALCTLVELLRIKLFAWLKIKLLCERIETMLRTLASNRRSQT